MTDRVKPAVAVYQSPRREELQLVEFRQTHCSGHFDVPHGERGAEVKGPCVGKELNPHLFLGSKAIMVGHDPVCFFQGIGQIIDQNPVLLLVQTDDEMRCFVSFVGRQDIDRFLNEQGESPPFLILSSHLHGSFHQFEGFLVIAPVISDMRCHLQKVWILRLLRKSLLDLGPELFHIPAFKLRRQ